MELHHLFQALLSISNLSVCAPGHVPALPWDETGVERQEQGRVSWRLPSRGAEVPDAPVESLREPLEEPPSAYRLGPVLVAGTDLGYFACLSAVRQSYDIDYAGSFFSGGLKTGAVDDASIEIGIGVGWKSWSFELMLTRGQLEDSESSLEDSGLGVRGGWSTNLSENIRVGADLALQVRNGDYDDPYQGDTSATWLQADLRSGLAMAPSASARFAIAPLAGLGLRHVDGNQFRYGESVAALDTQATYLFLGAALIWRPTDSTQASLQLEAQLGGVGGLTISTNFSF